MDSFQSLIR